MAADWSAADIGSVFDDDPADQWRYVPPAMRRVRARGALAALVILFAAGVVLTLALPFYAMTP